MTFAYENGVPVRLDAVVLSTQHDPEISQAHLKEAVIEEIVKKSFLPTCSMQTPNSHQSDRDVCDRWSCR